MTSFSGVVLTGGASTRMGTDKALLEVGGRALAVVAAAALAEAGATEVHTIGGDAPALTALGLDPWPDDHPGEGPLGGLVTALRRSSEQVVVVLSCDLPAVDASTVAALVTALDDAPEAAVAAPRLDGVPQVLTAAFRRSVAGPLADAFATGERSVRRALAEAVVAEVHGVAPAALADVDRPEDLHRYAQGP